MNFNTGPGKLIMSRGYNGSGGGGAPRRYEEDFSESEYVSDGQMVLQPSPDLTEIFHRKQQQRQQQQQARTYYSLHHQGYYEPQSRLPPTHLHPPQTCPCNPPVDPRYCWYSNHLNEGAHGHEGMVYNSSPIIQSPGGKSRRSAPPDTVKKYPVTVRTPRYCRGVPALYKRPSTLCLPVTCQPDPASYRRPRKSNTTSSYHHHLQQECYQDPEVVASSYCPLTSKKPIGTKNNNNVLVARMVDSEGDVNSRLNDLENLLTKFNDDVVDDDDDDQNLEDQTASNDKVAEEVKEETSNKLLEMSSLSDVAKILKPKVPASIKAKQEKIAKMQTTTNSQPNSDANNSARTHTSSTKPKSSYSCRLNLNSSNVNSSKKEDSLDVLIRHLSSENLEEGKAEKSPRDERKDYFPEEAMVMHPNKNYFDMKPPLDDNSALELHRSKSYIVSLIDKALSKELGTVPGDKCSRKEFMNMNPKRAVDLVNRHTFQKGSEHHHHHTNNNQSVMANTSTMIQKKESECICDTSYLKHLRNMRWTHLRQIQREARRLTDLERLLDSLSDGDQ